jgi:ABC-type polar amino acid transport system ATPase subunit
VSVALVIDDLHMVRGSREIIRGVDLELAHGEICGLLGPSGAGKSTILRAVAALDPLSKGRIEVGDFSLAPGAVPRESRLRPLRQRVGMVFQAHSLFEHLTAVENVTLAPIHAHGFSPEKAETTARALLDSLGVAHRADALPRQLSGGEAQRVAIARALAPGPKLLLMDEPTAALDPARREALGDSLRRLAEQGTALLIATHDMEFARAYCGRTVLLEEGRLRG